MAVPQIVLSSLIACALMLWAFWRLHYTPARGQWWLKLSVLCVFAGAAWWLVALLGRQDCTVERTVAMLALCSYLAWGVARDTQRRRERRAEWQRELDRKAWPSLRGRP